MQLTRHLSRLVLWSKSCHLLKTQAFCSWKAEQMPGYTWARHDDVRMGMQVSGVAMLILKGCTAHGCPAGWELLTQRCNLNWQILENRFILSLPNDGFGLKISTQIINLTVSTRVLPMAILAILPSKRVHPWQWHLIVSILPFIHETCDPLGLYGLHHAFELIW